MTGFSTLPLGKKIMQIRKSKGLSMENVAHAIKKSQPFISRFERGEADCSAEELESIKKFLEIENAPLFEHELKFYKSQLWVLHNLLIADRDPEAEALFQKLSSILDLPFEDDLQMLYTMFEIRMLLIKVGNRFPLPAKDKQKLEKKMVAEEKLKAAENLIDFGAASDEILQLYHCIKGSLCAHKMDIKGRIKHFLKALDHTTDNMPIDTRLYYYIGSSFISLGKPFKAMIYLEHSKLSERNSVNRYAIHINMSLALAYMCTGEYRKAEKMLAESLIQAESTGNKTHKMIILSYMGSLYNTTKQYEKSLNFFDQAIAYANNDNNAIVNLLCSKANSLRKLKRLDECSEVLAHARKLTNGDEHSIIDIETEGHCMTIDNSDSLQYLENVALPYFRKLKGVNALNAIEIYKELEAYYLKKRSKMKALTMAAIIRDIYEEAFYCDDDTLE